jgi:Zn-dependent M28 family amino/carboxypeptidase
VKQIFAGETISADDLLAGKDVAEKAFSLDPTKTVTLSIKERKEEANVRNVVAAVPGTDERLKQEYVAFGAHIDHVGMATSGPGDRIFNGADDDGSGTVSILEIAHAYLTGPRPKRSLLFVWHFGEEKGLWGSDYYTTHPTVDLKNVVTQLNIDMIGRSRSAGDTNPANSVLTGPDEIYVVGSTKMSTDLQKTSEKTNADFLKIKFNYKYDDPADRENIFYRSDHYNYARKGVPIIFYFDGVHEDYHRPGDEVSKIDFDKMSRVARTVYATGWNLANARNRPVVDKPLKG